MESRRQTVFEVCVGLAKALRSTREQFEALDFVPSECAEESEALIQELQKNMQLTEESLLDFATSVLEDAEFVLSDPKTTGKYDLN